MKCIADSIIAKNPDLNIESQGIVRDALNATDFEFTTMTSENGYVTVPVIILVNDKSRHDILADVIRHISVHKTITTDSEILEFHRKSKFIKLLNEITASDQNDNIIVPVSSSIQQIEQLDGTREHGVKFEIKVKN